MAIEDDKKRAAFLMELADVCMGKGRPLTETECEILLENYQSKTLKEAFADKEALSDKEAQSGKKKLVRSGKYPQERWFWWEPVVCPMNT